MCGTTIGVQCRRCRGETNTGREARGQQDKQPHAQTHNDKNIILTTSQHKREMSIDQHGWVMEVKYKHHEASRLQPRQRSPVGLKKRKKEKKAKQKAYAGARTLYQFDPTGATLMPSDRWDPSSCATKPRRIPLGQRGCGFWPLSNALVTMAWCSVKDHGPCRGI